jgi:PAS domain S-box-containing protein
MVLVVCLCVAERSAHGMKDRYTLAVLLLVLVILAAGVVAAGCFLYRSQRDSCRTEAEHNLTAVADLKVSELSTWQKERLADANVFYKNNAFSALVRRSIERPQDSPLQEELRAWIGRFQVGEHYDRVALLDAAGNQWMTFPNSKEPLSSATIQKAHEVLRSGQLTFEDFRRNEYTKEVHLRLFVPILDGQAGRRPLGVLMLRIDPKVYLYPLIQRWPTPSETAETLLIRREGNEAVFLNELKFRKNTALTLRVSLDNTELPAVKTALGQEGCVEGIDYRGVPVLAAVRAVPDSPWFLVARMDAAEVYAPMRERLWLTVGFVGILLFGLAAAAGFLWRKKRAALYRQKYEAERKYRNLFESSRDAMMTVEPPSWKFSAGNPAMLEMFRLKNARELTTLGPGELSPERQPDGRDSGEKAREMIETAVREGSHFFEWTHKRIDGQEFPATVLLNRVEQAGKVIVQATIRDITVQKQAEEERKKLLVRRQGINELQQSLLAPAPLEEKLRKVTDGIVRLFDADFCRIWLIRPGDLCQGKCIHAVAEDGPHVCRDRNRCLHLLASSGRYTHIDGQGHRRVPYGCYKIGRVASGEDHKFLTNDAPNDLHVHNHQWARGLGLVSFAGYQIRVPGRETLGVLGLFAKHPIDESEDAMLDGLSATVALVVQQKAAQEALRESEEWYKTLFIEALDGICLVDAETGLIIDCNQALTAMVGRDKTELIGKPQTILHPPAKDNENFSSTFRQHLSDKAGEILDTQVVSKTGEVREVAIKARVVNLAGRTVMHGLFRDITAQKEAEVFLQRAKEAAEASRAQYEQVVSMISDVVWRYEVDERGQFVNSYISPVADRLLGVPAGTIGDSFDKYFSYVHPEEFPSVQETLSTAICTHANEIAAEYRLCKPDGTMRWVSSKGSTYLQPDGHIICFGTTGDITDRKRVEERTTLEEARIRTLLELSQMTDRSAAEIAKHAMESAIRLTGSTIGYLAFANEDETVLTMQYWSNSAMQECTMVEKPIVYQVNDTGLWGEPIRQRKPIIVNDYAAPNPLKKGAPPGHVHLTRHMNIPVFDGGRIVAVAGVGNKSEDYDDADVRQLTLFMDGMWRILCRKRAEEQREHYAAELEATNKSLEKAKRLAECANRAKSEFLANMSHEIRTPMTAILGYADLMLDENIGRDTREHIAVIKRNGEHLLTVISDILDLSKIEAEKLRIESTRCSPVQLVAEVVSLMRPQATAKHLKLKTELAHPLPETVLTDPLRLRQILLNLVGNAIKFTDQGEIRLAARLNADNGRLGLCFDVSDTGIGMSEEQVGKLFKPFSQVDSSSTRKFGGTGLGLCISKHLAEALGGNIKICSKPGKGSTFSVMIDPGPLDGMHMTQNAQEALLDRPPTTTAAIPDRIILHGRILLAEDGLDNQRLIVMHLEKAGTQVTAVENGELAVEAALAACEADEPFDVILMDMQMPVMDGYEATRQLRKQGYTAPIVALTAHAMTKDCQKCLDAGCDDYLPKPFHHRALLEMVARRIAADNKGKPLLADDAKPSAASGRTHNTAPGSSPSESQSSTTVLSTFVYSHLTADPDFGAIVDLFVQGMPDRIDALEAQTKSRNWNQLAETAHQIKGAAGCYGFDEITSCAARLEAAARETQQEGQILSALDELLSLCRRVRSGKPQADETSVNTAIPIHRP